MKPNIVTKGFIWNTLQQYSSYFIKLIVQIVLGRLLEPSEFGLITEVLVFINIAEILSIGGLGTALIRKIDCDSTDLSTAFFANFLISLFLYLVLFFFAPIIGHYYGQSRLPIVLRVNGIIIYFSSGASILASVLYRRFELKKSFFCSLCSVVLSGIVSIVLAFKGFGVWALVCQSILYYSTYYFLLLFFTKMSLRSGFSFDRFRNLFSFSWKILSSSLLGVLTENSYNLFLGKTHGDAILGFYNRGNLFPHVIIGQMRTALGNVTLPALTPIQNNSEKLSKRIMEITVSISLVIFPITFGLIAVSDTLIELLLTSKWLPSVFFLRLECLFYCVVSITIAINCGLNVIGRSDIGMKIEVLKLLAFLLCFVFFKSSDVAFICWIRIVISISFACVSVVISRKILQFSVAELIVKVLKPFCFSITMGIAIWTIGKVNIDNLIKLIMQVTSGIALYSLFLFLFMNKEFVVLKNLITRQNDVS